MADYTSTQNGNWNTDATWGGGGHPSANDDTATIGHEVTYDAGDSAITWGNVTINNAGVLIFPISSDSTILFNTTGVLTINGGGELRAGTSGAPVDLANHCYFHWPQGAALRIALDFNNSGIINIYGDPTYYGSERYANLNDDWTAGQTLYIEGDYSAKWASGQKFYIHENIAYDNYQNDGHIYTIDTVGAYDSGNDKTPVTIVEAAPGLIFNAVNAGHKSKLIMISRNIQIGDPGAPMTVYGHNAYSEKLRFDSNQDAFYYNLNIQDAMFFGWYNAIAGGYNATFQNIAYISNYWAIYQGTNFVITGDFLTNNGGISGGTNHKITGDFVSNSYGIFQGTNFAVTGDFISDNRAIQLSTNHKITGDFVSNSYGVYQATNIAVTGDFILNSCGTYIGNFYFIIGDFITNTKDIDTSHNVLIHGDLTSINITNISNTIPIAIVYEDCTIASVRRELRIYENAGTILPLTNADGDWQAPDSDNDWILQLTPNSYCSTANNRQVILSPLRDLSVYCNAGLHKITFKIYPYDWTTPLDQDDIYIKARYLTGSGIERTTIQTTFQTYANAGWRECSVTFTTGQEGLVYFNLFCSAYEAGKYVLIDPLWISKSIASTLDVYSLHGVLFKFNPVLPIVTTSIEAKIFTTLSASAAVTTLVSDRIYPQHRPQNENKPSLVYNRVSGHREITLNEGYANLENPRISIEIYATAVDARRSVGDAVISAMEASTRFSAIAAMSPVDFYDPYSGEYRRILDFSIWNHDT